MRYLAERGADINAVNKEHETPLMKAADFGNIAAVNYLVQQGADVFAENSVSDLHVGSTNHPMI